MQALGDIFALWPSVKAMAFDVGVQPDTARKWKRFSRIPSDSIVAVARAVQAKGANLSPEQILSLNSPMRKRGRPMRKRRIRAKSQSEARTT